MQKLMKYKGFLGISVAVAVGLVMSSCNDQSAHSKAINDLNCYVQQHRDSIDNYLTIGWQDLDTAYQAKKAAIAKDTPTMSQVLRDSLNLIEQKWQAYKMAYDKKAAERSQVASMDSIRKSLLLDGVRLDYGDLKADRIKDQYQHFVDVVKANQDNYTMPQWVVVNVSWKALNGRRKEIHKDITSADMSRIDKLRLQYTGIKVDSRPIAEDD